MMNKVAYKIKELSNNKILWEVMPRIDGNKFVITSTTNVQFSGPETYMFASDEKGNIIEWCELAGSYRGGLVHKTCFENIGYSTNE